MKKKKNEMSLKKSNGIKISGDTNIISWVKDLTSNIISGPGCILYLYNLRIFIMNRYKLYLFVMIILY